MILHPRFKTLCQYIDGELDDQKIQRVAGHLERCPRCRKKIAPLTSLDAALGNLGGVSDEAAGRLMSHLTLPPWHGASPFATFGKVSGGCRVQPAGDGETIDAFEGLGLYAADRLRVEPASRVQLLLDDGSQLWLNGGTTATVENGETSLRLAKGELFARMQPQAAPFTVQTPTALLRVVGTTFEAGVTTWESTFLRVLEGSVSFLNHAGECLVEAKREVDATAHQTPLTQKIRKVAEVAQWVTMPLPGDDLFADPKAQTQSRKLPAILLAVGVAILLLLALGWVFLICPHLRVCVPSKAWQPPRQTTIDDTRLLALTGIEWPVGHRFIHRFDLNITSQRPSAGPSESGEQVLKQSQEIVLDITGCRHNGTRDVTMSFRGIRFEIRQGGQRLVIDSHTEKREPSQHPFAAILRAQQAARFDIRVSRTGEILAFEGFDLFKASVLEQVGADQERVVDNFLHEGFYRRMFALSLLQSPEKSNENGKSWEARAPFGASGASAGTAQAQYLFENWDLFNGHQCAVMSVVLDGGSGGESVSPSGNGRVWYDPRLGMIIKTVWMLERQTPTPVGETGGSVPSSKISQYLLCRLVEVESRSEEVAP